MSYTFIIPSFSTLFFVFFFLRFPVASWAWHNITYNSNDTALIYQPRSGWGDWPQASCLDWPIGQKGYGQGTITIYFEGVSIYLYSLFLDDVNPIYTVRVNEDEPVKLGYIAPRFLQRCDPIFSKTDLVYSKHRVIFNVTNERPDDIKDVIFQGILVTTPDPQDNIPFNATEQFSNSTSTAPGGINTSPTSNSGNNSSSQPSALSQIISSIISLLLFCAICACCYRWCCKGWAPRIPRPSPRPRPNKQSPPPLSQFEQFTRPATKIQKAPKAPKSPKAPKAPKSPKAVKTKGTKDEEIPLPLFRNSRALGTKSSLNTTNTTNTNSVIGLPPYTPSTTNNNNNNPISPPAPAVTTNSSIYQHEELGNMIVHNPLNTSVANGFNTIAGNPMRSGGELLTTTTTMHPTNMSFGNAPLPNPIRAQSPAWNDSSEALD